MFFDGVIEFLLKLTGRQTDEALKSKIYFKGVIKNEKSYCIGIGYRIGALYGA